tara:strand:+ start:215 stop:580 length:366 start_codon:yes stop_codon:yes gene_type:complete
MLKTLLVSGAVVSAAAVLASPAAKADGFYLNPEWNGAWSGSNFGGSVLDGHVGWEKGAFYIQGGPSWLQPDAGSTSVGISAKTGVSAPVAEKLDVYGEFAVAKYDGNDTSYGLKAGMKYKF